MLIRNPDRQFARVVNRTVGLWRRLAAMARATAKRNFTGNRAAQRMAKGWAEAALESERCRTWLLDAGRARRPTLSIGQPRAGQRVRGGARRQGRQADLVHASRQSRKPGAAAQLSRWSLHDDSR